MLKFMNWSFVGRAEIEKLSLTLSHLEFGGIFAEFCVTNIDKAVYFVLSGKLCVGYGDLII